MFDPQWLAGRRIHFYAGASLVGVLSAQSLPALPSPWWGLGVIPVLLLCCRWQWLLLPACVVAGAGRVLLTAHIGLGQGLPPGLEGRDIEIIGHVQAAVEVQPRFTKFNFRPVVVSHRGKLVNGPALVRLRWYRPQTEFEPGQWRRLIVRLKRPRGLRNPGGFDYERWLFRQGIGATGYVVTDGGPVQGLNRASSAVTRVRQRLAQHLAQIDGANYGLIAALAVGNRSGVTPDQWQTLRRTGTIHLLAISGLHIGLVASLGFILGRWFARITGSGLLWLPADKTGAVFALVLALVYAALAGFTVPTQRAMIMVVMVMGAVLTNRRIDLGRSLSIALLVVLGLDPMSVLDTGFWLSFGALTVIVVAIIAQRAGQRRWRTVIRVQCALSLSLAPMLLGFFGVTSIVSPLANLVAVPVVSLLVVPLTLTGVGTFIAGWISIADLFFGAAERSMSMLWPILSTLSTIPGAVWTQAPPGPILMVIATAGALWLLIPARWWIRALGLPLLASLLLSAPEQIGAAGFRVTVLDVGQGLSVLVQTRNHVLLYDTGARFSERFNIGDAVVLPALRFHGINRIHTLIVSHGDNDHIGGAEAILRALPVERRLTSVPEQVAGGEPCVAGQTWVWDQVRFRILHPQTPRPPRHNNSSCVVKIQSRYGSVLLTGDIEYQTEYQLVQTGADLEADVLLVPHQGSKTSSSAGFIDAVTPSLGLISAGYANHYGHPAAEVLDRYRARGIETVDTIASGAIEVTIDHDGIGIQQYRRRHRRYWMRD